MKIFTAKNTFSDESDFKISKENASVTHTEPHLHEFIELVYILSGEGRHIISGKVCRQG